MPRVIVRQNPDPRGTDHGNAPVVRPEHCPEHGHYVPSRTWLDFRRRAVSGEETPERAQLLLDTAARLRRRCPQCNQTCLTGPQWATRVRLQIERRR